MIGASVCVCGDDIYYDMASISLPSFVKSNSLGLTIFAEDPQKMRDIMKREAPREAWTIKDYYKERDNLDPDDVAKICGNVGENMYALPYNGYTHRQPTVAVLPLLAQNTQYEWNLKIDVDTYFRGDMRPEIEEIISGHRKLNPDVYIVSRNYPDIMVMLEGGEDWHGTGFVLWHRDSPFVRAYTENYTYSLQTTIVQEMYQAGKGDISYAILDKPHLHWVYPFEAFRRQGERFEKEDCEGYDCLHLHFEGDNILGKQRTVKGWFE